MQFVARLNFNSFYFDLRLSYQNTGKLHSMEVGWGVDRAVVWNVFFWNEPAPEQKQTLGLKNASSPGNGPRAQS